MSPLTRPRFWTSSGSRTATTQLASHVTLNKGGAKATVTGGQFYVDWNWAKLLQFLPFGWEESAVEKASVVVANLEEKWLAVEGTNPNEAKDEAKVANKIQAAMEKAIRDAVDKAINEMKHHVPSEVLDPLKKAVTNYLVKDLGKDYAKQLALQIVGHAGTPGLLAHDVQQNVEEELAKAVTISFPAWKPSYDFLLSGKGKLSYIDNSKLANNTFSAPFKVVVTEKS